MRTSYELALNNIGFSLGDPIIKNEEANQETFVSVGSSFYYMDVHKFSDTMGIDNVASRGHRNGWGYETQNEKILELLGLFPPLDPTAGIGTWANVSYASSDTYHVGYKTIKNNLENVTKAMLIAILDNDGKRSTSVGVGTTAAKKAVFFNAISTNRIRNTSIAPWNGWNDPVGVCTPTSVSRTNNVAIVTTTPAHGLSTSYDDWGIVMNLNTGIATSFNISTNTYPNGVPIKIIDANTFSYQNVGINTVTTAVSGIASVHVGWGGTSINLRMAIS
tara:strand:+ start:1567 stop:2394 length:828 start_codon:yes stop_codon:yes gene_type:complete